MSEWQKDQCYKSDVLQLGLSQGGWQVQNFCLENLKHQDGWRCLDLGHISPFTLWIKQGDYKILCNTLKGLLMESQRQKYSQDRKYGVSRN